MPPELPFEDHGWALRVPLGVGFLALFVVTSRVMRQCAEIMKGTGGVDNLQLEFLGSWRRAEPVLEAWRQRLEGAAAARKALRVDTGFIAGYVGLALTIASAAAGNRSSGWADGARWGGWAVAGGGLLDLAENAMLFRVLADARQVDWPRYAAVAAGMKWLLAIGGGLVVIAAAAVAARRAL